MLCSAVAVVALVACGGASHAKAKGASTGQAASTQTSTDVNANTPAGIAEREAIKTKQQESVRFLASPRKTSASTVLARVQGKAITFAAVARRMALLIYPEPLPEPPAYTHCIATLKAKGGKSSPLLGVSQIPPGQGEGELKGACETAYKHLLQSALSAEIHTQWVVSEAAEQGVHVSEGEVEHEYALSKTLFHTPGEFEAYRRSTGRSVAQMRFELKLSKLLGGLLKNIERRIHRPTKAEVAARYKADLAQKYTVPEGRAVRILRTTTQASARRAKQEIEGGKSFASLVKELSDIAQPLGARNGEVADLVPGYYQEKNLNDAIFDAPPHKLTGPILVIGKHKTIPEEAGTGSYVFEVLRSVPSRVIPLAQVRHAIAEELARTQREETLKDAVAAFRAKWRARTTCTQGFVVKNCREYHGSASAETGDPFVL